MTQEGWEHLSKLADTISQNSKKKISLPPPNYIFDCINKWRCWNLKDKNDEDLYKTMKAFELKLEEWVTSSKDITDTDTEFWRIRRVNKLIQSTEECWEPPAEYTKVGRCNMEKKPLLYVSEKKRTPFEELSVNKDTEQVYLIKYKLKNTLHLKNLFFPITKASRDCFANEHSWISYNIFRTFVHSEFLRPVAKETEYIYRISATMCSTLFEQGDINDPDVVDGWNYPSACFFSDANIAIKPEIARQKLELQDIYAATLVDKKNSTIEKNESVIEMSNSESNAIRIDFKGVFEGNHIHWQKQL